MSILLHMSLSTSITQPQNLSSSLFLHPKLSQLSLLHHSRPPPPKPTHIRMGGGPRTFPGGVSKWQWKRMQAKKAKQLLKARLCRERQIYEMRKRAELKAAVAELEKPWEVVERAPTLFSVKADEQLKVLADRFQRAGGFDMWSENDGPQLFDMIDDDLPSARFFPKGVVHSIKPYQRISGSDDDDEAEEEKEEGLLVMSSDSEDENGGKVMVRRNGNRNTRRNSVRTLKSGSSSDGEVEGKRLSWSRDGSDMQPSNAANTMALPSVDSGNGMGKGKNFRDKLRKNGNTRSSGSVDSNGLGSRQGNVDSQRRGPSSATNSMVLPSADSGNGKGKGKNFRDKLRKNGNMRSSGSVDSNGLGSRQGNVDSERRGGSPSRSGRHGQLRRESGSVKLKDSSLEVFDMSLQQDGSYGS